MVPVSVTHSRHVCVCVCSSVFAAHTATDGGAVGTALAAADHRAVGPTHGAAVDGTHPSGTTPTPTTRGMAMAMARAVAGRWFVAPSQCALLCAIMAADGGAQQPTELQTHLRAHGTAHDAAVGPALPAGKRSLRSICIVRSHIHLLRRSFVLPQPTAEPSGQPSRQPSVEPSAQPTTRPSISQTPTVDPTYHPSNPSFGPSAAPSVTPSRAPTVAPSAPTRAPVSAKPSPRTRLRQLEAHSIAATAVGSTWRRAGKAVVPALVARSGGSDLLTVPTSEPTSQVPSHATHPHPPV